MTVTMINSGYLPTASAMGGISRQMNPLQIRIDLPEGASLTTGYVRHRVSALAGNGGKGKQSWVVQASEGDEITLTLYAPSVGSVSKKVELKK